MSQHWIRRKCRCCKTFFFPDYRNAKRQHFCSGPVCRQASKAAARRRWVRKKGNRDYFRDDKNVERVQEWRKAHPGYWRKKKPVSQGTQPSTGQEVKPEQRSCNVLGSLQGTLQDLCPPLSLTEHPAFVGLISMVTGSTLQDEIAATGRNLILKGQNILGLNVPEIRRNTSTPLIDDSQTPNPSGPTPPGASQLQLG